jgi:hypothetical protein
MSTGSAVRAKGKAVTMPTKAKPAPKREPKGKQYRIVASKRDKATKKITGACISIPPDIAQIVPEDVRFEFAGVAADGTLSYKQVGGSRTWPRKLKA